MALLIGDGRRYAQLGGGAAAFGGGGGFGAEPILPNTPYDGQFTFVRMRYGPPIRLRVAGVLWSHDYPTGEQHFMKIVNELTYLDAAHRGDQHPVVRRSGAVQVSGRLSVRAGRFWS